MRKRSPTAPAARMRRARAAPGSALKLPAQCTLAGVEDLKVRLTGVVQSVKPVTVDAGAVERIDAAGMQLLAAFCRERSMSGLPVHIEPRSAGFLEAQRLLGLEALLAPPRSGDQAREP